MILAFPHGSVNSEAVIVLQVAVLVNCYTFAFNVRIIKHNEHPEESKARDVITSRIVATQVIRPELQDGPLPMSKQCLVHRHCKPCNCRNGMKASNKLPKHLTTETVPKGEGNKQKRPPSPKRSVDVPTNPAISNDSDKRLPPVPPNPKGIGEKEQPSQPQNSKDSGKKESLNSKATAGQMSTASKGNSEKVSSTPNESAQTMLAAATVNDTGVPRPRTGVDQKNHLPQDLEQVPATMPSTHHAASVDDGGSISTNGNYIRTTIRTKVSASNKPLSGTTSTGKLGIAASAVINGPSSTEPVPSGQVRQWSSEILTRTAITIPAAGNRSTAPTKQPLEITFTRKDADCNDDSGDLDIAQGDNNGKSDELPSELPRRPCGKSAVLVVAKPGTPKKRKYFPWIPGRGPKTAPDDLDIAIGDEEGNKVTVIPYDAPDPGMEELIGPSETAAVNGGNDITPEAPAPGLDNQNSDAPNTEIKELPTEVPNSDLSQTQNEPLPTDEGNAENEVNAPEDANVSGGAESELSTDHVETTDQDLPPADSDSGLTESNPPEVSAETGYSQSQPSPDSGENPTDENGNLSGPEDSNNPNEGTEVGGTAELLPQQPIETSDENANGNSPLPSPNDPGGDTNPVSPQSSDAASESNPVLQPMDPGNVAAQNDHQPDSGSTSHVSVPAEQPPLPEPSGNMEDLSASQASSEPSNIAQPLIANDASVSASVPQSEALPGGSEADVSQSSPEGQRNDTSTNLLTRSIRKTDSAVLPLNHFGLSHRLITKGGENKLCDGLLRYVALAPLASERQNPSSP